MILHTFLGATWTENNGRCRLSIYGLDLIITTNWRNTQPSDLGLDRFHGTLDIVRPLKELLMSLQYSRQVSAKNEYSSPRK